MPLRVLISTSLFILLSLRAIGQYPTINVHHLTPVEGLGDGVVRAIGQDKYGYMWIGTVSGLSRFDGRTVKLFQADPREPGSPPASVPRFILGDKRGNLWVGFNNGCYRFDYSTETFNKIEGSDSLTILKICEDEVSGKLFLLTNYGIAAYSPDSGKLIWLEAKTNGHRYAFKGTGYVNIALMGKQLYILSSDRLSIYSIQSGNVRVVSNELLPETSLQHLAIDNEGKIWIGFPDNNDVIRLVDERRNLSELVDIRSNDLDRTRNSSIRELLIDNNNRLWLLSANSGVAVYLPGKKKLKWHYFIANKPNAVSPYHAFSIFQNREGYIWMGTEGYGVDYFHPDKTLFEVISGIEDPRMPDNALWARSVLEDSKGNFWMAWAGGVSKYDPADGMYSAYENFYSRKAVLYNNSVRSLLEDAEGMIWIGTATGVNKYNPTTNTITFPTAKDSLPEKEFYWSIIEDHKKNIWYGTGNGLYYRSSEKKQTFSFKSHPVLSTVIDTGVRVTYEDSRKCLWFGMNGTGVVMFDPATGQVKRWKKKDGSPPTLLGNTITALTEDKEGKIWISSFNGLVCFDPQRNVFQQFTHRDKLPSLKCGGILSDDHNRLWIGTTSGLALLDSTRKNFTVFTIDDGLPSLEFSDMPAKRMDDGTFVFPTIRGFVRFNPDHYTTQHDTMAHYVSGIKIFDQDFHGSRNTESLSSIHLNHNENFFSFQLVALNYHNPVRTWYAYKLEGFDKEWIITNTGVANYTNVPGGKYRFKFKASVDAENWNVPEKQVEVTVGVVFYKSWQFVLASVISLICVLYLWYRSRINQQKRIYLLQSKAQILEKEKTLVKFESLKQQLNPHFLFNSLSSLGSLIRTNPLMAISFLEKLSKTYRYILQSRDQDLKPLSEETKFAQSYIGLLQTRFEAGLKVDFELPDSIMHKKVVPVILQNMIDNAIKHNVIDIDKPLLLRIYSIDGYLIVRNNLQKKRQVETSNKQGLNNLLSLYRFLTDKPMLIEETQDHFTVKIPLI